VIWGTLMVIPIEESLIYVSPLYCARQGGRIPELTRVIVAYENRIVMEETLEEGLARLFSTAPGQKPPVQQDTRTPAPTTQQPAQVSGEATQGSRISRPKRSGTTIAPSRRSDPATGPPMARNFANSVRCWSACARANALQADHRIRGHSV
jgi:uncharacterized membrane protein (UPF0182 family)